MGKKVVPTGKGKGKVTVRSTRGNHAGRKSKISQTSYKGKRRNGKETGGSGWGWLAE